MERIEKGVIGTVKPVETRHYNTKGQLAKVVASGADTGDSGRVVTLYEYNSEGELEYETVDMDQDGIREEPLGPSKDLASLLNPETYSGIKDAWPIMMKRGKRSRTRSPG